MQAGPDDLQQRLQAALRALDDKDAALAEKDAASLRTILPPFQ